MADATTYGAAGAGGDLASKQSPAGLETTAGQSAAKTSEPSLALADVAVNAANSVAALADFGLALGRFEAAFERAAFGLAGLEAMLGIARGGAQ